MIDSRCGLHCTTCSFKESHGCGGCIETNGHPFHGECPVAICCQEKGLIHCGECPDFPCRLLIEYSCHPEYGDHPAGERILQCKAWRQEENQPGFTFGGVNIYSPNPVRSLDFYRRLGLRVLHEPAPDDEYYGAELALGAGSNAPVIWIWRAAKGSPLPCNHLVFKTQGRLEQVHQEITARGIACEAPFTAAWGGREMTLTDPDGNSLLFL